MRVEVVYAEEGKMGAVVMIDRATGQEICRHPTGKWPVSYRMEIEQD